jgi:hypothetical protein
MMGWRVEERDAPSVPDPLAAARRRRSSCRHFPPMFVAALIAAYGDRIRLSGGRWARTDLCTPDPENGPPRGSYAVPAPHLAPTSARLPLESAKNFAQHLSWKT